MKKLLLLLLSLFSSAAWAMDQTSVTMSDDAPSFISKRGHKDCCVACCASVAVLPSAYFVLSATGALESGYEKNHRGANITNTVLMTPPLVAMSVGVACVAGVKMGNVSYRLDQRLHAMMSKEKTE